MQQTPRPRCASQAAHGAWLPGSSFQNRAISFLQPDRYDLPRPAGFYRNTSPRTPRQEGSMPFGRFALMNRHKSRCTLAIFLRNAKHSKCAARGHIMSPTQMRRGATKPRRWPPHTPQATLSRCCASQNHPRLRGSCKRLQRQPQFTRCRGCVTNYNANVDYFPSERRALVGSAAGVRRSDAGAGLHDLVPQELQGAHQLPGFAQVPPPPVRHAGRTTTSLRASLLIAAACRRSPYGARSVVVDGRHDSISFVEEINMLPPAGRWTPRT